MNDWFRSLDIGDDIEQVHSLYRTVKDSDSGYGYDVKILNGNGGIQITGVNIDPYTFASENERSAFCDWLDEQYSPSVEARREAFRANQKKD